MGGMGLRADARLDEISQFSSPGEGVTRLPFTAEHKQANRLIKAWMQQAGMRVKLDAAGTLVGRLTGQGNRQNKTFILGSHQDSVRNGGRFDGIMGVVLACLAVDRAFGNGEAPDFSIEVHAYADEEGVRFPTALLGPRALAGSFDPAVLEMTDAEGVSIHDAIKAFGGQPGKIEALSRSQQDVLGYLEIHIEQGPVLEQEDLATGVVTSICGIERNTAVITGSSGHAGTVPMTGRRDALIPAAKIIAEIQRCASQRNDVRATVGTLSILPGAVNQIPAEVSMSLEIRSAYDDERANFRSQLLDFAHRVVLEQGCELRVVKKYEQLAQSCDSYIVSRLLDASQVEQGRTITLPSGATHDASALAALCPIGMLFVRCRDGVSHVPEEYASPEDMERAVDIVARFLHSL